MEENKKEETSAPKAADEKAEVKRASSVKAWFIDFFKGVGIGLSSNIPGASGGTTAVLVNIYDRMIEGISALTKHFKEAFLVLLPIVLGVALGFLATLKPMELAMENIPFGISCIFIALIIGSTPSLIQKVKRKPNASGLVVFFISLGVMIGINFIPGLGNYDLSKMTFTAALLTFIMGIIGAFALIIPGVSGALLLFVFGFYNPILGKATDLLGDRNAVGLDLAFLVIFALGVIVGFLASAKAMKWLIKRYEYGTYMGIMGFITGSVYSILHPFILKSDSMGRFANGLYPSCLSFGWHIGLGVILFIVFAIGMFALSFWSLKKQKEAQSVKGA